jgi:hypothetical protein
MRTELERDMRLIFPKTASAPGHAPRDRGRQPTSGVTTSPRPSPHQASAWSPHR